MCVKPKTALHGISLFLLFIVSVCLLVGCRPKTFTDEEAAELLAAHEKKLDKWMQTNLPNADVKQTFVVISNDGQLTDCIGGVYRDGEDHNFYFNTSNGEMYTDVLLPEADNAVFTLLESMVRFGPHVSHMGQGRGFNMDMPATELVSGKEESITVSIHALPYDMKSAEIPGYVEKTLEKNRESDMVINITLNRDSTGDPATAFPPVMFWKYPGLGTVNVIANNDSVSVTHTTQEAFGAVKGYDTIVYRILEKKPYGVSENTAMNTFDRIVRYDRRTCKILKED